MKDTFIKFMQDPEAWEMFVTGRPGVGKTTDLAGVVQYCIDEGINYTVCAYTHKACGVLRSKLPVGANIATLHSFLRKCPTINDVATKADRIEKSLKVGDSDKVEVLIIDEFTMVGEQDLMDIRAMQDDDYDGSPAMKVLWVGDRNQLPPVKDMEAVIPHEPYWVKLTVIKRQADGNRLIETIHALGDIIEGLADPEPLERHETFVQCEELLENYHKDTSDKVVLAYTNERVQALNAAIVGRDQPIAGDRLFCGTGHRYLTMKGKADRTQVGHIDCLWGESVGFNSKYKTLEFLLDQDFCEFYIVEDDESLLLLPGIFGTYNYKKIKDSIGKAAAAINAEILSKTNTNPAQWAKANPTHPLARKRALAWRRYLTFKDYVVCLDFDKAMTVHKSQGSTFDTVYLDAEDLSLCKEKNFLLYARLYYVAISRASKVVYTN